MQSTLTLRSLPLAITHISKLSAAGFETVGDLRDVGIIDLSKGEPEKCLECVSIILIYHARHF